MAHRALETAGIVIDKQMRSVDAIGGHLKRWAEELAEVARNSAARALAAQRMMDDYEKLRLQWKIAVSELDTKEHPIHTLADADRRADTTIRFRLFLLATHYWEGRWLLEIEKLGTGLEASKQKKAGRSAWIDGGGA